MQLILPSLLTTLLLSAGALAVPQPTAALSSPSYRIPQKHGITDNDEDHNNTLTTRSAASTVGWVAAYSLNDSTCTGTQIVSQISLAEKGKCYPFNPPPHSNFHIDFGTGDDAFTQLDFYDAAHCDVRSRHIYVTPGKPDACDSVEKYHGDFMSVVRKD